MQTDHSTHGVDRSKISVMLMKLFDHWGLNSTQMLGLLGYSPTNRGLLSDYRSGKPLANDRDKLERAGILLGIHKSLRLLFPHNRQLAYTWMTQANRAFGGLSPVTVAEKYGIMGLHQVRSYLDVQRGR
ncbi:MULTISPECIES: MbcA/ParS/Xre antitoxin family protein [Alcaligenaceae]|jgi:hypothetical protein|uniref:Antitoxin Xre/MbcA/ParS-like toxin-binding domain-containing protein n=1 Tax=Neopusillimonas maritima TaxID=2026239 RepID=A0ABX9MT29_9BURK|nr:MULTISPECIES: MbcA/ParS/Xre antitoxin family protein [Alcaligenaceae]QIM49843.1 DUF2384 domain-containing protein [Pusillimonas sp. DMV24BSW_D]RII82033.1 hypothetical protein CJO09_13620 [Neopusillimonas maritima]|tara:strand:+ start:1059 stop:1445 length:387 start_codon:yes stop_codon:yes gene_type:complete